MIAPESAFLALQKKTVTWLQGHFSLVCCSGAMKTDSLILPSIIAALSLAVTGSLNRTDVAN